MYCRNCGEQIADGAAVCVKCGFDAKKGTNFCSKCGKPTMEGQAVCTSCGFALNNSGAAGISGSVPEDKRIVCGILAILFAFGIHNFILGETKKGILHILLWFPGCILIIPPFLNWVWSLIEGIKILTRSYVVDPDKWFSI